jgi:large subunit ribosomal protein L22
MTEVKAEQKYLLVSPEKIRGVARVVRKLDPIRACEYLNLMTKKVAVPLRKVILQAIANARQKGLSETDLVFKEIQIGGGPALKRGIPVSRGQWHPLKKRMSHIRVVLMTNPKTQTLNSKETEKSKLKNQERIKRKETKNGPES